MEVLMSTEKQLKLMLAMIFIIEFLAVATSFFVAQFLGLESYGPSIAGMVGGITMVLLNIAFRKRSSG
jgi:hypothetical protein